MLLRSASTPILKSWIHHYKEGSPGPEIIHRVPRYRHVSLTACSSSPSFSPSASISFSDSSTKKMTKALSETDLRDLSVMLGPKKKVSDEMTSVIAVEEEGEEKDETSAFECGLIWGANGLCEECEVEGENNGSVRLFVGDGVGGAGGKIHGGGGSGGGRSDDGDNGEESSGFWDPNHGSYSTDVYYQKLIAENPGNSLLLSNYAKFLKEVQLDYEKAEEYCGRAILENPDDGNALSLYGDLIWQGHKDASRAEDYFDRAVKAAPDDCYVHASYARFLWDAEEDEEEEEEEDEEEEEEGEGKGKKGEDMSILSPPVLFHGVSPPLAAAS